MFAMPVGLSLMRTDTATVMVGFGFGPGNMAATGGCPLQMETKIEDGDAETRHLLGSRWSVVGNCHDANKKVGANKDASPPA
jgi:hypothetical protein